MTVFLTLLILTLISVSIWQVSKILELSQPKTESTEVADDNDNETFRYSTRRYREFNRGGNRTLIFPSRFSRK